MSRWARILGLTPGELAWLAAAVALLVYEIAVVAFRPEGADVLTRAYRANATRWVAWPIGTGVLMGHLNGPVFAGFAGRWSPALVIAVGVVVVARDLLVRTRIPEEAVMPLFLLGFILGVASWVGRP